MLRLLCVTAHPDDEAGGFGGTLLACAKRGIETHVLCMTAGQAASNRGSAASDAELMKMRRTEFAEACKILKVTRGEVLDYPDGKLERADFYSTVADLTRRMRVLRPQVVITMGPDGAITGHPDHSMVSIFATMAFHWAGRNNRFPEQLNEGMQAHRGQKLYYATTRFTIPQRPPVAPAPVTASIDIREFLEAKIAAFKAHTTQAPLFGFFEDVVRKRGTQELFHLAAASTPRQAEQETDLFAGVSEE
jgi:LmbE family N-acetylglucosaminyl deacetylase